MPVRIQRKRTKGWRMPEGAIYVGRPTKYGNIYVGWDGIEVELFRKWIASTGGWATWNLEELRGKDLACWCPLDRSCHADVLLEIANQ